MRNTGGNPVEKSTGGTRKKIPGEPVRKNTSEEPIEKEERSAEAGGAELLWLRSGGGGPQAGHGVSGSEWECYCLVFQGIWMVEIGYV